MRFGRQQRPEGERQGSRCPAEAQSGNTAMVTSLYVSRIGLFMFTHFSPDNDLGKEARRECFPFYRQGEAQ